MEIWTAFERRSHATIFEPSCIWSVQLSNVLQYPSISLLLCVVSNFGWMQIFMFTAAPKFPFLATVDYGNWAGNASSSTATRPFVKCLNNNRLPLLSLGSTRQWNPSHDRKLSYWFRPLFIRNSNLNNFWWINWPPRYTILFIVSIVFDFLQWFCLFHFRW